MSKPSGDAQCRVVIGPARLEPTGSRRLAVGGIVGPVGFVAAWVVAGAQLDTYSPVGDAISELARSGTSARDLMTLGFLAFAVGVGAAAIAIRGALPGPSWVALLGAATATAGVAATPLGSQLEPGHRWFAGVGYLALALAPALAVGPLRRMGRPLAAGLATAIAITVGLSLLAGSAGDQTNGLLQRFGLTLGDCWIVWVSAATLAGTVGARQQA
jgi:hypothetical protein